MTWVQDQRIAFIKERIDAGESVTRAMVAGKFYCTHQTVTATFHEFKRRHPGLMAYDEKAKAYRRADLAARSELAWKDRALAAEARADRLVQAATEAVELLLERRQGSPARSSCHNARLVLESGLKDADGTP